MHWGRNVPRENALAYLLSASVTKKKSFVTLIQGVNVTKPFSLSPMKKTNKLERSFLKAFSNSANFCEYGLGLKHTKGESKCPSLFIVSISDKEKKFCNIDARSW